MMTLGRRSILAAGLGQSIGFAATGAVGRAQAQQIGAWPRGLNTSVVVPYTPGGPSDSIGRHLARGFAQHLGGNFSVENRPGASTTLAARQMARGRPDGTSLLIGTIATFANAPHAFRNVGYDPVNDFTHITLLVDTVYCLVANLKWSGWEQVLRASKAEANAVTYASQGIGTTGHLPMVELAGRTGVTWLHVPYSGGAPAVTSVVAGQTDLMFATFGSARALLADGKIRPLAISLLQRSELLPDVPTFEELGIPGFAPGGWYSLAAPPGMSEAQTAALADAAGATITSETFRDFMRQNALTPLPRGPAQALSLVKADLVRQGALMQRAGIRPE